MNYFLSFALMAVIYLVFVLPKTLKRPRRAVLCFVFYVYLTLVLYRTVMPFVFVWSKSTNPDFMSTANFDPFVDIKMHHGGAWREVLLNGLLTLPMGLMLPMIFKPKGKAIGLLATVFAVLLTSAAIECVQLFYVWANVGYERIFDVTDLIMNTLGGVVGYLIYFAAHKIKHK